MSRQVKATHSYILAALFTISMNSFTLLLIGFSRWQMT
jgi:hypothetical protein